MASFGAGMGQFDEDPVFGNAFSMMRQMDTMMTSMMRDPFGGGGDVFSMMGGMPPMMAGMPPMLGGMGHGMGAHMGAHMGQHAIGQAMGQQQIMGQQQTMGQLPMPLMLNNMIGCSTDQLRGESNYQTYSSSSVMSMTTGPDGRPQIKMANKSGGSRQCTKFEGGRATQVYQSSSSSQGVPGGLRQTQQSVTDSRSGVRKLAIGHYIGDRSHIVEREQNRDGDEERHEYFNLDEEEADEFEKEFRSASGHYGTSTNSIENRPSRRPHALAAPASTPPLAIENRSHNNVPVHHQANNTASSRPSRSYGYGYRPASTYRPSRYAIGGSTSYRF